MSELELFYEHTVPSERVGSVPISVVAKVYGKSEAWVRSGIVEGWLPIGIATRDNEQVKIKRKPGITAIASTFDNETIVFEEPREYKRINYYVSPYKLFCETGFIWHGEE